MSRTWSRNGFLALYVDRCCSTRIREEHSWRGHPTSPAQQLSMTTVARRIDKRCGRQSGQCRRAIHRQSLVKQAERMSFRSERGQACPHTALERYRFSCTRGIAAGSSSQPESEQLAACGEAMSSAIHTQGLKTRACVTGSQEEWPIQP
jgi:hypothetical protein